MDLYTFTDEASVKLGLRLNQSDKERIISTLRVAGYREVTTNKDKEIVTNLISRQAQKLKEGKQRGFFRGAATENPKVKFEEIKDLNKQGLCGKCKSKTTKAKLADKEEINFCPSCKATLWQNED